MWGRVAVAEFSEWGAGGEFVVVLKWFEVDLGHHTACGAAAVGFDGGQGGVEDAVEGCELCDLFRVEGMIGLGRHDQQSLGGAVVYLEHIAGEAVHLFEADGDEGFAGGANGGGQVVALGFDGQGIETDDDIAVGDAHHDIGVIDSLSLAIDGGEDFGRIACLVAKVQQDGHVGSRRQAGISDLLFPVEDHAAGAFEENTFLFIVAEVEGPADAEGFPELLQYAGFAFQAAVGGIHGIQTYEALFMKGDPVVGKDGVGGIGLRRVVDNGDVYVVVAEQLYEVVEFKQGLLLRCAGGGVAGSGDGRAGRGGRRLESVVDGGFRVKGEVHRPYHQDVGSCLHDVLRALLGMGCVALAGRPSQRVAMQRHAHTVEPAAGAG